MRNWKAGWHSRLAVIANELTWTALIAGGIILAALLAGR
jgi:hypothetical protein